MATSIYVYRDKGDYDTLYKGKSDAWTFQTPILDLYLKPKDKLWVITNTSTRPTSIDLSRTIVHFNNGQCFDWMDGDETLVEKEKIVYNPKNNNLEFFPRHLRKPLFSINVDKVVGGKPSKKLKIKFTHKYYDVTNNRINLFV